MKTVATAKKVVKVSILGEEYSIRSETRPEEALAVAEDLEREHQVHHGAGRSRGSKRAAITRGPSHYR